MSELRLNVGILFVILAGGCAGMAWIEGTAGFASEFARQNHEHLMLAFPALAAICGMVGGFLMGTLMLKPTKSTSHPDYVAVTRCYDSQVAEVANAGRDDNQSGLPRVQSGSIQPSYFAAVILGLFVFMLATMGGIVSGLTESAAWLLGVVGGALTGRLLWGRV